MSVRNLEDYTDEQLEELANTITEEEFEQLDELSKGKLGAYMGAASNDIADASWGGRKGEKAPRVRGDAGAALKAKRAKGMRTAATKWLNKEENEDVVDENKDELEETAALDTIKPKSVHMADIIHKMSGMCHDDITKLAGILDQIGKEAKPLPGNANAAANKSSVAAKGSAVAGSHTIGCAKEDLINMFGDEQSELSEEFINKTSTLFEAAVNLRVNVIREEVYEEAERLVEEVIEERTAELIENLDNYLNAAVNEWIEQNEVPLETNIRTLKAEAFLEDLSDLFEEHNIIVPEGQEDVVESLMGEVDELKTRLNEALEINIENQKLLDENAREDAFDEIAEGLAATQVEKLRALTEGLEAADLDEFRNKVTVIREQHFKEVKTSNLGVEIDSADPESKENKNIDPGMRRYTDAITKAVKNS